MKKYRLFMIPFAGGNKYSFRDIAAKASERFQVVVLEFPGHGSRFQEPLLNDINLITDDLYQTIRSQINGPYFIFGHSMGGLLAWLLVKKIALNGGNLPGHMFIAGAAAPSATSRIEKKTYLLGVPEFKIKLKKLSSNLAEVLDQQELFDLYEPVLRADFKAYETYEYTVDSPLNVPLTVITGTEEEVSAEDLLLWKKESTPHCKFVQMNGGHFFILQNAENLVKLFTDKSLNH